MKTQQFLSNVGPYTFVSRTDEVKHEGRTFILVLYGAYNAMGLIASEVNGIAVLDDDLRLVVLDGHSKSDTGYFGPSQEQVMEYERIKGLDAAGFVEFVNAHPRLRQPVELRPKAKPRKFNVKQYVKVASKDVGYQDKPKEEFLRGGKSMARIVAARLGLNEDQYDIRVNRGGIAVSGEVVLHAENLYVNLGQSTGHAGFWLRRCSGRRDFTGGRNVWCKWVELLDLDTFIAKVKREIGE